MLGVYITNEIKSGFNHHEQKWTSTVLWIFLSSQLEKLTIQIRYANWRWCTTDILCGQNFRIFMVQFYYATSESHSVIIWLIHPHISNKPISCHFLYNFETYGSLSNGESWWCQQNLQLHDVFSKEILTRRYLTVSEHKYKNPHRWLITRTNHNI